MTMLTEAISISEAFKAGASGYVLKQSAFEELRSAIDTVLANKRFLSQSHCARSARGIGTRVVQA